MGVPGQRSDGDRPSGKEGAGAVWVLMHKYNDLPMDLADAALVATAETTKIKTIFTLDYKYFSLYRPLQLEQFELIPKQWP